MESSIFEPGVWSGRPAVRTFATSCTAFYDDAGNVIGTHEHAGDFKEP